jgi:hypothetical protein
MHKSEENCSERRINTKSMTPYVAGLLRLRLKSSSLPAKQKSQLKNNHVLAYAPLFPILQSI